MRKQGRPSSEKKRRIVSARLDKESRHLLDMILRERPDFNMSEYIRLCLSRDFMIERQESLLRLRIGFLSLKIAELRNAQDLLICELRTVSVRKESKELMEEVV